ncbi:precorrin-3B C(17)-methyltransferase [Actinokineospora auranticolor]|uniref:Precorrin-2 C20-methyltransferase/precorrin-3B C17-methyltransferase n=1 Tax=Actinokineospora auranticolor TaxID=155976 RepID=A0A2S6H0J3_9PSEU|nr:precorrin-3B C(17)-methyltransferase [Actinokineospora auranticolor]PPK70951.1 precorrin-2 C20-methyltransferase/precorrin-3B C17-methyltransferase [Actinokineospora auranticolor]
MTGTLYGVGLGPGDPDLVTVKAARLIAAADVIAYHSARHGRSIARGVAAPYLRAGQIEEPLVYPLTVETTDHPGGYAGAMAEFYEHAAARLAAHLDAGRDVVVLAEGDPLFYGSYMHMHKRLCDRYPTEVVPGVTSVSAAAAVLGKPLVEGEEVLSVLPGTLPEEVLTEHLTRADSAAVLKLGRTFTKVRAAFEAAGKLERALYVERATWGEGRSLPLSEVDPESVPYFSLAMLTSPSNDGLTTLSSTTAPAAAGAPGSVSDAVADAVSDSAPASASESGSGSGPALGSGSGEVVVVGTGPAGRPWMTPEAVAALAEADDLVGYKTYLDRVPVNPRQRRHASDNQVEAERAEFALDLARRGRRVAVVSSGDPGVFAMAAAVLEVAEDPQWTDVPVRVLPGLTAAQAVASRVGAPLGHDFCVLSLSDRLKPWDVITARLAAVAAADLVIALYNPASKSRTWQLGEARGILLGHRAPDTPVVIGRDVGGPEESIRVVRLADLDPTTVDMRCLVLVGSSRTRVVTKPDGGQVVYTPRHYP